MACGGGGERGRAHEFTAGGGWFAAGRRAPASSVVPCFCGDCEYVDVPVAVTDPEVLLPSIYFSPSAVSLFYRFSAPPPHPAP